MEERRGKERNDDKIYNSFYVSAATAYVAILQTLFTYLYLFRR
jgi:hypothetical protein